ncbi:hypothetical protein HOD38_06070 [archaeon]|jgi:uncharacterized membrane protein YkoI|nr:hypothetical protein [archaeon]MBT4397804.1 hypothetical protein [archaeon]MBT4441138.1 hypothetical protein [archaeon]
MLEDIKERVDLAKEKGLKGKFVSAFYMGDLKEIKWQIDFFEEGVIHSFLPDGNIKEDSLLSKEELKGLDLDEIKVDLTHALQKVEKIRDEKYEGMSADKVIVILQKTDQVIWNITWLTKNFKVFNVKVDAVSGEVLRENCESIMGFKKN